MYPCNFPKCCQLNLNNALDNSFKIYGERNCCNLLILLGGPQQKYGRVGSVCQMLDFLEPTCIIIRLNGRLEGSQVRAYADPVLSL